MAQLLKGNGRFDLEIVGESYRQDALARLAGPKCPGGYDLDCLAALLFHDDNPHDRLAVAVAVVRQNATIALVGHLSRATAREYRKSVAAAGGQDESGMLCRAKIVGGWDNGLGAAGMYGVKLDLVLPLSFGTAKAWENWQKRLLP